VTQPVTQPHCRIDLYEIKARLRRANGLRAALRAVLDRPVSSNKV